MTDKDKHVILCLPMNLLRVRIGWITFERVEWSAKVSRE